MAAVLGLAGVAGAADFGELAGKTAAAISSGGAAPAPEAGGPELALRGPRPVEFVRIPGGGFKRGNPSREEIFFNAKPVYQVYVRPFEMSRSEVTVAQYAACVAAGQCGAPAANIQHCNWGVPGREDHPVNCVSWEQAAQYAAFAGARLPTEAEWEYAASNGGVSPMFPWGNSAPGCGNTVMNAYNNFYIGCGNPDGPTMKVCSKPAGNTRHGLCDMPGNVREWVQDIYRQDYFKVPVDGTAYEVPNPYEAEEYRVVRGGSYYDQRPEQFSATVRARFTANSRSALVGFRLAR